jgi:hypothetical protein
MVVGRVHAQTSVFFTNLTLWPVNRSTYLTMDPAAVAINLEALFPGLQRDSLYFPCVRVEGPALPDETY